MESFFQGVEGKGLQVIRSLFSFFSCFCVCITYVFCFHVLSQSSFYTLFVQHVFVCFQFCLFCFYFKNKKKIEKKSEKYKNSVCFVYFDTCVPWMAIETKSSKLCIIFSLDEYFYAQLSK